MGKSARDLSKWLQLMMSCSTNTMAFSITPYFSSDANHQYFVSESAIGFVFAAFPAGYMTSCALMSMANISHVKLGTIAVIIRILVVLFVVFSAMFALTPTLFYHPNASSAVTAEEQHNVGMHYAFLFGAFRMSQGITVAALDVLILMYLTKLFPDKVSSVVGEKEAVQGLGVVVGPPLGGVLYQAGGFSAPPLLTGGIALLMTIGTYIVLLRSPELIALHDHRDAAEYDVSVASKTRRHHDDAAHGTHRPRTHIGNLQESASCDERSQGNDESSSLLFASDDLVVGKYSDGSLAEAIVTTATTTADEEVPFVVAPTPITLRNMTDMMTLLPLYVTVGPIVLTVLSIGCFTFLESMVPLYSLDTYGVQAWGTGLTMGAVAIVYAITAVLIGKAVCHPREALRPYVLAIATVVLAIGMFLVAPSFVVVDSTIALPLSSAYYAVTVCGVLTCGAGMAIVAVAAVALIVDSAKAINPVLVPAAAATVSFTQSLGGFLGPIVGSTLSEQHGFPVAFFSFSVAAVVLGAMFLVLVTISKKSS